MKYLFCLAVLLFAPSVDAGQSVAASAAGGAASASASAAIPTIVVEPVETAVVVAPVRVAPVAYQMRCVGGQCYRLGRRSVAVSRVRTGWWRPWRSRAVARTRVR
jgi:hypothetical protein